MKLNTNLKRKHHRDIDEAQFHKFGNNFQRYETSTQNRPALRVETISDADGLERAYKHGDYFIHGKTMYVAGSHTAKDWFDDFTKVPFYGDLRESTRYQNALQGFKENPGIDTLVGHSLGGSVVLEMQKNIDRLKTRTYGAPVFNPTGGESHVERYRNWFDPFFIFDRSANRSVKTNPFDSFSFTHDYSNIGKRREDIQILQNNDQKML